MDLHKRARCEVVAQLTLQSFFLDNRGFFSNTNSPLAMLRAKDDDDPAFSTWQAEAVDARRIAL